MSGWKKIGDFVGVVAFVGVVVVCILSLLWHDKVYTAIYNYSTRFDDKVYTVSEDVTTGETHEVLAIWKPGGEEKFVFVTFRHNEIFKTEKKAHETLLAVAKNKPVIERLALEGGNAWGFFKDMKYTFDDGSITLDASGKNVTWATPANPNKTVYLVSH